MHQIRTGLQLQPDGANAKAEALALRAAGVPPKEIAAKLGFTLSRVYKMTRSAGKPMPLRRYSVPDDPALAQRIFNLARRGFDVPPSKQADWDNMTRKGVPLADRISALKLE